MSQHTKMTSEDIHMRFVGHAIQALLTEEERKFQLQKMDNELLEALEDLLEAIPSQNNDQDWWPDELTKAVRTARAVIAKARPE